ncbi:MAG: hypothetical protein AAFX99_28430 [Myxococcota bacterium]
MDLDTLNSIIDDMSIDVERHGGIWEFTLERVALACMTDLHHDRMRFIAPIMEVDELTNAQVVHILEANFHTALDARYATSHGVLYAVFIHPLSSLIEEDARSGLRQVVSLVRTFGTHYTSGELVFGTGTPGPDDDDDAELLN